MKARISLLVVTIAAGLAGCTVGPNYRRPDASMPAAFSNGYPQTQPTTRATRATTRPVDIARWWESLGDPELNSLVQRAVVANPDLQIAMARLQEARTAEAVFLGSSLPVADASGGAGRGSGTDSARGRVQQPIYAGPNTTGLREVTEIAGFDASWEIDIFGHYRREIEAAGADAQAAAEARNMVLITLVSDVARAYVDVRATQMRLIIANNDVKTEQQSVDVIQTRFNRGITNELDLALAKRELATVKAQVAPLAAQIDLARRRVAVLIGKFPNELAGELTAVAPLPQAPDRVQPGLPVELLRRRPDIRNSERQLAAATARIGVATADLFPRVDLTAGLGVQAQGLGRSPAESQFIWSAGPAAYWPLLDFGTLDSLVTIQDLRTREALLNYQKTILAAVEEVNDAISNYSAQQDRLKNLGDALVASEHALNVASQRYDRGLTDYLNVLDAQRQYYILMDQYAQAQQAVTVEFIAIYKGLGGGWQNFTAVPPGRSPRPAIVAAVDRLLHPDPQPTQIP